MSECIWTDLSTYLPVHRDNRGYLVIPTPLCYCAYTLPGHGREKERWHVHHIQTETFVCMMGTAALATSFDGKQVVIHILEGQHPENQVIVSPGMYHSLVTVGDEPSVVIVSRDVPYNPDDTERIPMIEWSWGKEEQWLKQKTN